MTETVAKALSLWGMDGAQFRLIAARENAVYRVDHADQSFALRLHRKGYRTDAELRSELDWMAEAARGGITVPAPVASTSGAFLHVVERTQIDMLDWLPGQPLIDVPDLPDKTHLFSALGAEMAKLHLVSDAWDLPESFSRCAWDRDGLLGAAPLWDRFWENPFLSSQDRTLFETFRSKADADLSQIESSLDYGLIHADLVPTNAMTDGQSIALIDFDDGGFGFRLFDISTALLKLSDEAQFPTIKDALLGGYRSLRPIDTAHLDLFMALRATTYVGWNITRMDEDGGAARNTKFINTARRMAQSYLGR